MRLAAFRPNVSRVAGPRVTRFAPVTDYSVLDAWRYPLRADCSALRILRPVPATDLTRRPTLDALRRPRIAPFATPRRPCWPRITPRTDRSVFSTLELCPEHELLHTRHLASRASLGLLLAPRFLPCAAHGSLRARPLALHAGLRIAPYSDTSRPDVACGSLRAQHLSPAPDTDCSVFDT